ncbi:transient receptor potential cation channel subfamily A member 1-like isoform X2 [Dysidea avara]
MEEISKSTNVLAIEEGSPHNPIPEETSSFRRRVMQPTVEELAAKGKLSELQQIKDYTKLHSKSQHGFTLLHHAAKENKAKIIEFLVSKGCDIDADDDDEQTALHKAAMFGCSEAAKVLLENRGDVNRSDGNGNTPLHIAIISGGDVKVIETLITKADPSIKNNKGQNALHVAVKYHKIDTIKLILNHPHISTIISDPDDEGYIPLHLAVSLGHFDTTEQFLNRQDLGIDISASTKKGKTIIHLAATANDANLLAFILEVPNALYLINKPDKFSHIPIHDAAEHGSLKQVSMLLDRGSMIVSTVDGYTPLHFASFRGHLNVAAKLIKRHPFQKDLVTNNGDTALHLAATNGHSTVVKLLLDNGVPITHNAQQVSFLDIAVFKKDSSVALVAVNHGRWQECLDLASPNHPAPMIHLVETLPDVAQAVMDHSITSAQLHPQHPCYWKQYDFKYLLDGKNMKAYHPHRNWYQFILHYLQLLFTISDKNDANPLKVIKTMLQHNRKCLLVHPLLLTFLNLKWRNYGRLYIQIRASLLAVLAILLSILIAVSNPPRCQDHLTGNCTKDMDKIKCSGGEACGLDGKVGIASVTLFVNFAYIIILVLQLISYIRQRKVVHWFHTFVELGTVVSTAIFILTNPENRWLAAVGALLCAWVALNLFSRYFDVFGLYTIMFYDLLFRITKALLVGLYYIIGFGLIIYILIGEEPEYRDPVLAIYNTFIAALRGFNFQRLTEREDDGTLLYTKSTYAVALVLTVVLTITLVNLLIGISVGSIGNIQKDALLHQAKLKIQLFLELDPNIPRQLKGKIIPTSYKIKGSASITDRAYSLWNFIVAQFAPYIQGEEHEEMRENQEDNKVKDIHYRIKQMERQVESVLKHQKALMDKLKNE